ncbi:hypothetical protein B0H16DRAFT_1716597 [Mycena metata]|uniref:Uncharacterized protein n=1 Tax=Mycena metata TaxID=1033252 RepID=A0AAD7JPW6_9AGAR|nr:hypothetical protein B0H16DRAFT_1716597 [Mycena metata]
MFGEYWPVAPGEQGESRDPAPRAAAIHRVTRNRRAARACVSHLRVSRQRPAAWKVAFVPREASAAPSRVPYTQYTTCHLTARCGLPFASRAQCAICVGAASTASTTSLLRPSLPPPSTTRPLLDDLRAFSLSLQTDATGRAPPASAPARPRCMFRRRMTRARAWAYTTPRGSRNVITGLRENQFERDAARVTSSKLAAPHPAGQFKHPCANVTISHATFQPFQLSPPPTLDHALRADVLHAPHVQTSRYVTTPASAPDPLPPPSPNLRPSPFAHTFPDTTPRSSAPFIRVVMKGGRVRAGRDGERAVGGDELRERFFLTPVALKPSPMDGSRLCGSCPSSAFRLGFSWQSEQSAPFDGLTPQIDSIILFAQLPIFALPTFRTTHSERVRAAARGRDDLRAAWWSSATISSIPLVPSSTPFPSSARRTGCFSSLSGRLNSATSDRINSAIPSTRLPISDSITSPTSPRANAPLLRLRSDLPSETRWASTRPSGTATMPLRGVDILVDRGAAGVGARASAGRLGVFVCLASHSPFFTANGTRWVCTWG